MPPCPGADHKSLSSGVPMATMHDFEMASITGERVKLSQYKGQVCLIVNVATK